MTAVRLLVVDTPSALSVALAGRSAAEWQVLPVGHSAEWWAATGALPAGCRVIDPSPWAERAHQVVAEALIPWTIEAPKRPTADGTLHDVMRESEGSAWWWIETSERGPYRGPLVMQLFQIALVRAVVDALGPVQIHVALSDPVLSRCFAAYGAARHEWNVQKPASSAPSDLRLAATHVARVILAALRLIAGWMMVRLLAGPAVAPRPSRVIFSMYPAWWTSTGERFFVDESRQHDAVALCWISSWRQAWRLRATLSDARRQGRVIVVQQWARMRDVSLTALRWLSWLRRHPAVCALEVSGVDVAPLVRDELRRAFASGESVQNRVLSRALRRAIGATGCATVLYRLEGQPTEHALIQACRDLALPIGFLHYPFRERYLSMRLTHAAQPGTPGLESRPLPGGVLASGQACLETLLHDGYPAARTALCGPQRYPGIVAPPVAGRQAIRARLGWSADEHWILVAPAIVEADSEALAAAILTASDSPATPRWLVRPHPNRPWLGSALATVADRLGPQRCRLQPSDVSLSEALAACDAMVCVGSMIAFEAMAAGLLPIVFEHAGTYAATSLRAYAPAVSVVANGRELLDVLNNLRAVRTAAAPAWPATLDRIFGDTRTPPDRQLDDAVDRVVAATARLSSTTV